MNVGIIGSGFIVDVFCKNCKMFKELKPYAIWGRHKEKIESFSGFKRYYTDINDFLDDKNIDVVYIALPNSLHFEYALKALKAKKHVLLEKPFCTSIKEAKTLINYAKKNHLLLYEAIMTLHAPNYLKAKSYINKLGNIKMIDINFSQFSRKYNKFLEGDIKPAFDYKLAGGALMDLGVYSIHFVCGLFGKPRDVIYYPNIVNYVDTSGVLVLDYKTFKASLIFSKDSSSPSHATIQGDKGYIQFNTTTSRCSSFNLVTNDGKRKEFNGEDGEFVGWKTLYKDFINIYKNKDYDTCYKLLNNTIMVQQVLDKARISGNLLGK